MRCKLPFYGTGQKQGTWRFIKRVSGVENRRFWGNLSRKYQKRKRVNRAPGRHKKTGHRARFCED
ncbi:hypothetical protein, partial [Pantoea agglomerans]|uniref:hypothetical protein n=1 Tax=Enterobacter agglomerans TaxID=549 RepID=UPI001F2129BD